MDYMDLDKHLNVRWVFEAANSKWMENFRKISWQVWWSVDTDQHLHFWDGELEASINKAIWLELELSSGVRSIGRGGSGVISTLSVEWVKTICLTVSVHYPATTVQRIWEGKLLTVDNVFEDQS